MGREAVLSKYKINLSHQEMERIMSELEAIWEATPTEWLSVEAAGNWICHEMGYEDMEEFHDGLQGTFKEFLSAMPNVELGVDDKGREVLKLKPAPEASEWRAVRLTLPITQRSQLWNVLLKSKEATLEIPELEFEISADGKKKIDSLYNHIAAAIFNLGCHVRTVPMAEDTKNKIMDTILDLNVLLDVEQPWTCIVHDPSGQSEFSDMEQVAVEYVEREVAAEAAVVEGGENPAE